MVVDGVSTLVTRTLLALYHVIASLFKFTNFTNFTKLSARRQQRKAVENEMEMLNTSYRKVFTVGFRANRQAKSASQFRPCIVMKTNRLGTVLSLCHVLKRTSSPR